MPLAAAQAEDVLPLPQPKQAEPLKLVLGFAPLGQAHMSSTSNSCINSRAGDATALPEIERVQSATKATNNEQIAI